MAPVALATGAFLCSDLCAQCLKIGGDTLPMRRPYAQQNFLPGRQRLQLRVCKFITQPGLLRGGTGRILHLHQSHGDRRLNLGRLQQMVDHRQQACMELLVGITQSR